MFDLSLCRRIPDPMSTPQRLPSGAPLISRRTLGIGALATLGTAALAACSGGLSAGSAAPSTTADSGSTPTGAGFPATVAHAYGKTVVPAAPQRVVSAGVTEQDFLLALGILPVGVTDWYGDQPGAIWPWARAAMGSHKAKVLKNDDGFQFVEIAALKPDLIVGTNSGMTKADYDKLTKIAPTLAPDKAEGWFAPWSTMLTMIAGAVGKQSEGEALVAQIKKGFADAAAANPAFAGKKVVFLQNAVYDGNLIAYQKGLSTDFLTDLGFDVPSEIDQYVKEGEQAYIPVERISVLNAADVLVWGTESDEDKTKLEQVPGFKNLKAVKSGASVYTGGELAGAIYFTSPLSLPYVLDKLVPMLAAAVK